MKSSLIQCSVFHTRTSPRPHKLKSRFFWFGLDLEEFPELEKKIHGLSFNRWNFYSFYDRDHIDFGKGSLRGNVAEFLRQNGVVESLRRIRVFTHLRVLGYVFNPITYILCDGVSGAQYAVIEVGNTFNEIKPFFVPSTAFQGPDRFEWTAPKEFYVSPFIPFDSVFRFRFLLTETRLQATVVDQSNGETVLTAGMRGEVTRLQQWNLLGMFFRYPMVTWKVIFLIHLHALMLYWKGIPYFKKKEFPELQKGMMTWKK